MVVRNKSNFVFSVVAFSQRISESSFEFVIKFKELEFLGHLVLSTKPNNAKLPDEFKKGSKIVVSRLHAHQVWLSPPPRYSEATLVKALEDHGIGRPSTYASILAKMLDKGYVEKRNVKGEVYKTKDLLCTPATQAITKVDGEVTIGKDTSKLLPTELGMKVNDFMCKHFTYIVDSQFTAEMETHVGRDCNR